MIKILYILLVLLIFPAVSDSSAEMNLEDYINSFSWDKRIVLLIAKENHINVINETDDFFRKNSCENEERNLKYIRIVGDDANKYIFPNRFKSRYGVWLIGYDSRDKSYSNDASLLKEIHHIIDAMPIRKTEIVGQNKKCNQ